VTLILSGAILRYYLGIKTFLYQLIAIHKIANFIGFETRNTFFLNIL